MFDDVDGDQLTITTTHKLPANIIPFANTPLVVQPSAPTDIVNGRIRRSGGVFFHGVTAATSGWTEVRVDVKATDPGGASASTYVMYRVPESADGSSTPSLAAVATQALEVEQATIVQLPAATSGDVMVKSRTLQDFVWVTKLLSVL